jgi:hypothetical protein
MGHPGGTPNYVAWAAGGFVLSTAIIAFVVMAGIVSQ